MELLTRRRVTRRFASIIRVFSKNFVQFFCKKITEYDYCFELFPLPSEEEEFLASLIPEAGKYTISIYQKTHVALERVGEFVVTEPLSLI
jgi:hypothetical protein